MQTVPNETVTVSTKSPLLHREEIPITPIHAPLVVTTGGGGPGLVAISPGSRLSASPSALALNSSVAAATSHEYRFVHQRIPAREGKLRFLLPALLILLQVLFIVLFAIFGNYNQIDYNTGKYPQFQDLQVITVVGFGFLMAFLKRYGYGSLGFNLLLVALVVQWAIIVRGFLNCTDGTGQFYVNLHSLVNADYTAVAVVIAFGAVLGKTTLTQLVVLAIIAVVIQALNEYINVNIMKAYDVGRAVYVHLFGALFGLAASKCLNVRSVVKSFKQASVYHSDVFAFIGTLFIWVYYPSFNSLLAYSPLSASKAIINTYAAMAASCVITFAISSLVGKGKINAAHVLHASLAGGIAVGAVADLHIQIYVALIAGALAGLLSTVGYQYIDPLLNRVIKLHDTCGVHFLHAIPALISAILGAIYASFTAYEYYGNYYYTVYPGRVPLRDSEEYLRYNLQDLDVYNRTVVEYQRTGPEQAGFQLAALAITILLAVVTGALTGLLLRVPLFEQLSEEVEMFDDEAQWITPDDYALKLTFAKPINAVDEKIIVNPDSRV